MARVGSRIPSACCALLLIACATANAECKDDWVCIDEVSRGDTIELQARNLRDFPVTFTLQVEDDPYDSDGASTVTRTLRPRETSSAVILHPSADRRYAVPNYRFSWSVGVYDANHDDDHLYAFPYAPGRSFRVMQGFGSRFSHAGIEAYAIDFEMPVGSSVHAARSGVVARIEESNSYGCFESGCGRFANFVVILHNDGTTGEYYHLQKNGVFVEPGDSVARGQLIGRSGNTGYSMSPHLHFAVYRASDHGNTQSVPIRFQSADGIINRPRSGGIHRAAFQ
jgi:murein DD-endopeptidase MepM/ murein hydrolase activator NlpD